MLDYELIKSKKRRTICIQITEHNQVRVLAPTRASNHLIQSFVQEKSKWIQRTQERQRRYQIPPLQFVRGETCYYLGEAYTLQVSHQRNAGTGILGRELVIYAASDEPDVVKLQLCKWYKSQALDILTDRVYAYQKRMGVQAKGISIRNQKTRWGSCSSKGNLNFNWRLVMAPLSVLDYVVVHELCHLIHMNHSREFWLEVERYFPDFKAQKKWLKEKALTLRF